MAQNGDSITRVARRTSPTVKHGRKPSGAIPYQPMGGTRGFLFFALAISGLVLTTSPSRWSNPEPLYALDDTDLDRTLAINDSPIPVIPVKHLDVLKKASSAKSTAPHKFTDQQLDGNLFEEEEEEEQPQKVEEEQEKQASAVEEKEEEEEKESRVVSNVETLVSPASLEFDDKPFYRFTNVKLTGNHTITVYYPDDVTPPKEHYVDILYGNATSFEPPTVLVIDGMKKRGSLFMHVKVKYEPASKAQPHCYRGWISRPTYLFNVRYSTNVWHSLAEGLVSMFQTMREMNHLRLAAVDEAGNVKELLKGAQCPWARRYGAGPAEQLNCRGMLSHVFVFFVVVGFSFS